MSELNNDLVYAVVLPKLDDNYDDVDEKKKEYTIKQAKMVDFTDLPARMNHGGAKFDVGKTVAYRVREPATPDEKTRAEVILKLHEEAEQAGSDHRSQVICEERNLLMEGAHVDVSLEHVYDTKYLGNCGTYSASATTKHGNVTGTSSDVQTTDPYGDPGRLLIKVGTEISFCDKGKRPGSKIIEYLPCRRSLRRSKEGAIRSFVKRYKYPAPDAGVNESHPGWSAYIDTLSRDVAERRQRVLSENGYADVIASHGTYSASDNGTRRALLKKVPWVFLPVVESRFNAFAALGGELVRDEQLSFLSKPCVFFANTAHRHILKGMSEQSSPNLQPPATTAPSSNAMAVDAPKDVAPPKRVVAEVVPNSATSAADKVNPIELVQQQRALLEAKTSEAKALQERLSRLEQRENEREVEANNKRKRDEDEANKAASEKYDAKKAKFIATARAKLEEVEANAAGGVHKDHLQVVRDQLLGQLDASKTMDDLARIETQFGPILALAHAASVSAKSQREDNEQRELRAARDALTGILSDIQPTGVAVSGGQPFEYTKPKAESLPDSGTVSASASRFNVFGEGVKSKAAVHEVLPAQPSERSAVAAAAKAEIDYSKPGWGGLVIQRHIEQTGMIPNEQMIRHGGAKEVTTYSASANGQQVKSTTVQPGLAEPFAGQLHMGHIDKECFDYLVAGINEAKKIGGKRPDKAIAECIKWGETDEVTGKSKYLERYTGPIKEDNLLTMRLM